MPWHLPGTPAAGAAQSDVLLAVDELRTTFTSERGVVRAVDGVSFEVCRGEILGLVGESGCGKSAMALSILRLIPPASGRIEGGRIDFEGRDLARLAEPELRRVRGHRIAMVFQDPMTSLNPAYTVGEQIAETLREHLGMGRRDAWRRSQELLGQVGIPNPARLAGEYPHRLSGGMRQRVMIAAAISCEPALLIADEPTTALDVTIQAQILELLTDLRRQLGMGVLLITHDLGVVAQTCDRVMVMYAGRVVEQATTAELFANPRHPYTRGLLASIPRLETEDDRLRAIPGTVPGPEDMPAGCRFAGRCPHTMPICWSTEPELGTAAPEHLNRCWLESEHREA